jgi:tetratricopeptide (TPR) repeat protein/V8-like Glu-specific endopeptidase
MKTWLALGGIVAPFILVLPAVASSSAEVAKVAKAVTVLIKAGDEQGSGAIINHSGNTYTVLTAAHVVKKTDLKYTIELNDGQVYPISGFKLAPNGNLDLAVVQFKSDRAYSTIKIGNSNTAEEGTTAYVAGFPFATAAITQSVYTFSDGKITANSSKPFANGYSIVYSCNTLPGMSGGPVLNEKGELIAVHGKGDNQERIKQSEVNSSVWVKTGFNLGIPVNTFTQVASTMGVTLNNSLPQVAIQPRKTTADDFFVSATNQFLQGNYPGAIVSLNQAIKAKPDYSAAYIARAEANLYLDNGAETFRDANLALKYNPNSDAAYALRGAARAGGGDTQSAYVDFDKAVAINPRNSRAYLYRGFAELLYEDPQKALQTINKALKNDPNSGDAFAVRATAKQLSGDLPGSEADFKRALQLNPNSFLAYAYRGYIRAITNNKEAGFIDMDKAIALSPKNPIGYLLKGQAYTGTGQHAQGIQQFNQALKIKPNYDIAYANRSIAYIYLEKYQQGLADAEKALSINPNSETAYQARAVYYVFKKQFQKSLADANRALSINPSSPDSVAVQGLSYVGLNERAKAKTALKKSARLYEIRNNRGEGYQAVIKFLQLLG